MRQLYLDYNATTPIAPSVQEAMLPLLAEHFGNPSSNHAKGRAAAEAVEDARGHLAVLLGCDPDEIVFTSGGTESNNLALQGVLFRQAPAAGGHLIISAIEHPSVAAPARFLERLGSHARIGRRLHARRNARPSRQHRPDSRADLGTGLMEWAISSLPC